MLAISRVPLAHLVPNDENPRLHGPENLDAIAESLAKFGQAEPLVVQASTRRVIGGNGRLAAMKDLGWVDADVVELDLDDAKATALGIALNRTAELAHWDAPMLSRLLEQLKTDDALGGTGYSPADLDALIEEIQAQAGPREVEDPGAKEPPATPVARFGDLWMLGEHRLLCGDSTKAEDVDRVLTGELAALVATDPPYVIDYVGDRPYDAGKDWSEVYREIDIKDPEAFFRAVFTSIKRVLAPHAPIYCWFAHKRLGLIQRIWEELGILDHQEVIWVKPSPVFGRVHWHFRHEPCVMGWAQGSAPPHDGDQTFNSVWEVDWDGKQRVTGNLHPTEKPVELFARPMRKHSKPGDLVFEPFSGSGSQLIAAERERRRCRAVEIQPAFVDVAIERWQEATKQDAVLEGEGRSFAEVAKERLGT